MANFGVRLPSGLDRRTLDQVVLCSNPTDVRNLGKFVHPTLPKSLGKLLVYPKRMAVGVERKEVFFCVESVKCAVCSLYFIAAFYCFRYLPLSQFLS